MKGKLNRQFFASKLLSLAVRLARKIGRFYPTINIFDEVPTFESRFRPHTAAHNDVAILIQGPICAEDNFTLNTVINLRAAYPLAQIVVSTWVNTSPVALQELELAGAKVLTSTPPNPGPQNINLQLCSTQRGLNNLPLGVDYVLKLRTDQRFDLDRDILSYFKSLLKIFPPTSPKLKGRLVAQGVQHLPAVKYPISDFFMFGYTEDMRLFWGAPYDNHDAAQKPNIADVADFMKQQLAEGYLVTNFMSVVGYSPKWTWGCSDEFLTQFFCIVDQQILGRFWLKYHWEWSNRRKKDRQLRKDHSIGHIEWINIYTDWSKKHKTDNKEYCSTQEHK